MNIGVAQVRGIPFYSFYRENVLFYISARCCLQFLFMEKKPVSEKKYIYTVYILLKLPCLILFLKFIF